MRNATQTFVGSDVRILSNATQSGDGGLVIIWADGSTRFHGSVTAEGGEGGFAEISGKDTLAFRGTVDLAGSNGRSGTLLLDPATITIMGGTGDGAADGNNTFAGDPSGVTGTVESSDTAPVTVFESEIENLCHANLQPNLLAAQIADNPRRVLPPQDIHILPVETSTSAFNLQWDVADAEHTYSVSGFDVQQLANPETVTDSFENNSGLWLANGFFRVTNLPHSL